MTRQKGKWYYELVNIIPRCNNSECNCMKFKTDNGEDILYIVDELYKIGDRYLCDFLMIRRIDNGNTYLICEESAKELINRGYIVNAKVDNGYIRKHPALMTKYDITHFPEITSFDKKEFEGFANDWKKDYKHIIVIDNIPDNRIEHRLEVSSIVYDLSKHVIALEVENEFEHDIISLAKAEELGKAKNNQNNVFPCTGHRNATKLLPYYSISEETYESCVILFGEIINKVFIRNTPVRGQGDKTLKGKDRKLSYKCALGSMPLEVAKCLFGLDRVYFAIPNPEKFKTKKLFESALLDANHLEETHYSKCNYTLINCIDLDRETAIDLLKDNFDELHSGEYLNHYKDTAEWLLQSIKKEHDNTLNNLRDFVLNNLADGKSKEEIMSELESQGKFKITDDIDIVSMIQLETNITAMKNAKHERIINSPNFKNMSFDDLLDILDLSLGDPVEDKPVVHNKKDTEQCLGTVYLDTLDSVMIKLFRNEDLVSLKFINRKSNDEFELLHSNVTYSEYINNGISNEMLNKSLSRLLKSVGSKLSVDDIIKELEL